MTEYPTTLIVEVTEEDIANGVKGDCFRCPIACAVMRLVDETDKVKVTKENFSINGYRYSLPFNAIWFIKAFDNPLWNRKIVEPIKFEAQRIL